MFDPDNLPPLREVIATHNLRAEKSLGQNFLLDMNITGKIARLAGDLEGKVVIETGPGPGGLTRSLLKTGAKKVIAVEYDRRAVGALQELVSAAGGRLEVREADALSVDFNAIEAKEERAIVANLPYNIATPLLVRWLRDIHDKPGYQSMTLLFQKEVAERLYALPGSKTFGRLSVLARWLCEVEKCFDIPARAFTPSPKVTSTLVRFRRKIPAGIQPDFSTVELLTRKAFGQRRKMVRSSLKEYAGYFDEAGIDPGLRAEDLKVEEYIRLAVLCGGNVFTPPARA